MLTIKQLKEQLFDIPDDAQVYVRHEDGGYEPNIQVFLKRISRRRKKLYKKIGYTGNFSKSLFIAIDKNYTYLAKFHPHYLPQTRKTLSWGIKSQS